MAAFRIEEINVLPVLILQKHVGAALELKRHVKVALVVLEDVFVDLWELNLQAVEVLD